MRSRYKIIEEEKIYFISSTIVEWIPVFTNENYFKIVVDSIEYSQKNKNLKLYAYVILDNHFHMIASGEKLRQIISSIKSFTARTIIDELKLDNKEWLLNQLSYYKLKYKIHSDYQLWQEGFHPQVIYSDEMLKQKIDYIHYNPVKRGYVIEPQHWRYSSASYYILGIEGELKIDSLC